MLTPFQTNPDGRCTAGWYREGKSGGPTIIAIHGIHGCADNWSHIAELMPPAWTFIALDLRGHGKSSRRGPYDVRAYAEDVLSVATAFRARDLHMVGTSFGGSIACVVAAENPAWVRSLVAVGSARVTGGGRDADTVVDDLHRYGVNRFFAFTTQRYTLTPTAPPHMVETIAATAADRDPGTVEAVFRAAWGTDIGPIARRVRCPSLVLNGELDLTCPPAAGAQLAAALGVQPHVVGGVGHLAVYEHPEAIAAPVVQHIRSAEEDR